MLWWMIVIYIWLFYHGVSSPTLCIPRWRHMCPSTDRIQCPTVHLHTPPHGLHILCYLQQVVRFQSYTGLHAGIELQVSNYDAFFWHIIKFTNNWVTLLLQLAYECIVFQLVGILYSMQTVDSIPRDSEFPTLNGILCCNIERRSFIFFFLNTVLQFAGVCYWHTCNAFATNSHEYTSGTVGNCKLRRIGSDWESECSLCIKVCPMKYQLSPLDSIDRLHLYNDFGRIHTLAAPGRSEAWETSRL